MNIYTSKEILPQLTFFCMSVEEHKQSLSLVSVARLQSGWIILLSLDSQDYSVCKEKEVTR